MMLNFVIHSLYDIKITTNKFCLARMYSLKKPSKKEIGELPFSFLLYKIALKLKLL
jgi:hypothetical protein